MLQMCLINFIDKPIQMVNEMIKYDFISLIIRFLLFPTSLHSIDNFRANFKKVYNFLDFWNSGSITLLLYGRDQ